MAREEKMGATDDQALAVYTRKNFKKKEKNEYFHHNKKDKKPKKTKRDISNIRCYTYDEKGHLARDCTIQKRRHHAHIVEYYEPTNRRFRREKDDSDEEYVLISAVNGTISHRSKDLLVDSGDSKHMMGYKGSFLNMSGHESPHKVKPGDDYQYPVKGSIVAS